MINNILKYGFLFILLFIIIGSVSAIENVTASNEINNDSCLSLVQTNNNLLCISENEVALENVYSNSGYDFIIYDDIVVRYATDDTFQVTVNKNSIQQECIVVLKEGNKELASGYSDPDDIRMYGDKLSLGKHTGKLIVYNNWAYSKALASIPINFTVIKTSAYFYKAKTTAYYDSGTLLWFDLTPNGDYESSIYVKCKVQVKNKGKWKTYYSNDGGPGFKAKGLTVGKHKVIVTCLDNNVDCKKLVTYVNIKKAKARVTTTSTNKYFNFKVKSSGKVLKNFKIKVKVYTGSNFKVKYVKTNKNGIARLYVGDLKKKVYHKIQYSSANKNYYLRGLGGTNTDYYILY